MRNRRRMVCVSMFCSLLLAACGLPDAGSGGGGSGGSGHLDSAPVTGPVHISPPEVDSTYATYAQWNQAIRAALPTLETCATACGDAIPTATGPFRSPFGATAAFDAVTDRWTALWAGDFHGYSHSDPGGDELDRRWAGAAALEIESADPSRVRMWGENVTHFLKDGGISGVRPDSIPDGPHDPWFATLSAAPGRKGYFSGDGIHGQFDAAPEGTVPGRAIGHIHRDGHTGVFEVRRQ